MARRSATPPPKQPARLTPEEIETGIARISRRLDEVRAFDPATQDSGYTPDILALKTSIDETLVRVFGADSLDYQRYHAATNFYAPMYVNHKTPPHEVFEGLQRSKEQSLALLEQAIRGLREDLAEGVSTTAPYAEDQPKPAPGRKVFIVHGHAGEDREAVARFLEKLGFEAIILHERPNKGRTIITKFQEEAADIGFAVVLMTPDDHGGIAGKAT